MAEQRHGSWEHQTKKNLVSSGAVQGYTACGAKDANLSRGHVQVVHCQIKTPLAYANGVAIKSLAVSYFHVEEPHTIIGAEQFHFRVRDGIGWFPLAMAARQTFYAVAISCHNLCSGSFSM